MNNIFKTKHALQTQNTYMYAYISALRQNHHTMTPKNLGGFFNGSIEEQEIESK
jgi:hypothetical protein